MVPAAHMRVMASHMSGCRSLVGVEQAAAYGVGGGGGELAVHDVAADGDGALPEDEGEFLAGDELRGNGCCGGGNGRNGWRGGCVFWLFRSGVHGGSGRRGGGVRGVPPQERVDLPHDRAE